MVAAAIAILNPSRYCVRLRSAAIWLAMGSSSWDGADGGLVPARPASPARPVTLHHAVALGERDAAGQRARERAERLAVVALDQAEQDAVAAGALRLGGEAQVADRVERSGERDGRDLARHPVDPDRPLAAGRRVVHAGDEVPHERAPVRGATGAGAPVPRRLACVVAGGLVDE